MIWRSTILFLTSLTVATVPVASLQAQSVLMAQSSTVDPNAALDTGQATPDFSGNASSAQLQRATSEPQIEDIKTLQQELKNRGYYNGPIDGIYGPGTDQAIRELRGQVGENSDLTPSLFPTDAPEQAAPSEASPAPPNGERPAGEPNESEGEPAVEDSSVRINADNIDGEAGEINLGDTVSPTTGTDPSGTDPSGTDPLQTVDSGAATQAESPGSGGLLWLSLALVMALGSFGVGFVFARRVKPATDDEPESPWGAVPDAVPGHQAVPSSAHLSAQNGHTGANGRRSAAIADGMMPGNDSLPVVSSGGGALNATTRLAKVDVMDELVANLQVADPSQRRKAIWELGQRGNSSAVQHLVNGMVDADSKEKSLILAALSEIGIRSLKPLNRALAIALQDDNPDVRKNAIRDLTRVYDLVTQISQMLGHATEDEDAEVRRTAEWALEQLNRIREAPKLKSSINTLEASRSTSELLPDEIENLKN